MLYDWLIIYVCIYFFIFDRAFGAFISYLFLSLCQIWISGSFHHAGAGGQASASESVSSTELRG